MAEPGFRPPRDDLVRAIQPGIELRADTEGGMPTLFGHFARFGQWNEINSMWEGNFMEQVAPGAYAKTIAENRSRMKVTFNHGSDPSLGDKVLGPIDELHEDKQGPYYEVPLLDTSYNRDLLPGLEAGLYGASYRFRVMREEIVEEPGESAHNPKGLPERTIKEAQVMEFGPVTYPADAGATAGVRSLTDEFMFDRLSGNRERLKQLVAFVNEKEDTPVHEPQRTEPPAPSEHSAGDSHPEPERRDQEPEPAKQPAPADALQRKEDEVDPNKTLAELEAREKDITAELQRLDAEVGTGVLNDTQRQEWDSLTAERKETRKQIAAKNERIAELDQEIVEPSRGGREPAFQPFQTKRGPVGDDIYDLSTVRGAFDNPAYARKELQDRAMRAIDGQSYAVMKGRTKEELQAAVEHLVRNVDDQHATLSQRILATGHPLYEDAFWKKLAGRGVSAQQDALIERALGVATTGYAMPFYLDPTVLLTSNGAVNPLRQIANVVQITGQTWNGVNSAGVTAGFTAEATELSDNAPTLTQATLTVLKADAFVPYSIESEGWSDIRNEIASEISDAKDVVEANKFTLGTGTLEPTGFTVGATSLATTAGTAVIALSDIDNLQDALPPRFQPNAVFVANRKFYSKVRQLSRVAGVNDQWPNPSSLGAPQLNEAPRYEVSDMVGTTTTSASLIAGYGDFRKGYLIVDRVGMQLENIQNLVGTNHRPTGQRGIVAYWFTNGVVRSVAPLRLLKIL
jgi:HK97 family phage major capsid protein/HK97 family phage prohead protease